MYKVKNIEVDNSFETFLTLENTKTKKVEKNIFDDSGIYDYNFSFMKKNEKYHCKIELKFYEVNKKGIQYKCKDIVSVGQVELYLIEDEAGNQYYIQSRDNKRRRIDLKVGEIVSLVSGRKDLIQVNDVIHGDFLDENLNTEIPNSFFKKIKLFFNK